MELLPRIGIGGVQLGLAERDVVTRLGPPRLKRRNLRSEDELVYEPLIVVLGTDSGVVEISALPESLMTYNGRAVFSESSPWRQLVMGEQDPREYMGIIVLPSLQLALSGFHDQDPSQQAVTVFAEGRWDHLLPKSKPFTLGPSS